MPKIAAFCGIVIAMNDREHGPPHFHAKYGEHRALFAIAPIRGLRGHLPARAERLIIEWAALHERELVENWNLARAEQPLLRVAPLD